MFNVIKRPNLKFNLQNRVIRFDLKAIFIFSEKVFESAELFELLPLFFNERMIQIKHIGLIYFHIPLSIRDIGMEHMY
jgi:hypothetical protein